MTLIVAIALPDGDAWMGGERLVGTDCHALAGPKVFKVDVDTRTSDSQPLLLGFAGSPRVAQTILAVTPPIWEPDDRSLHAWLTDYCDRIRRRCQDELLIADTHEGGFLVGDSCALLAVDGHVVRIGCDLSWQELAQGWIATGVAWETFGGAYEALLPHHGHPLDAAREAWPVAERLHRVGPLADELTLS